MGNGNCVREILGPWKKEHNEKKIFFTNPTLFSDKNAKWLLEFISKFLPLINQWNDLSMFAKKHVILNKVSFPGKKSPCLHSQVIAKNKPLMEWLKFIRTRASGREGGGGMLGKKVQKG